MRYDNTDVNIDAVDTVDMGVMDATDADMDDVVLTDTAGTDAADAGTHNAFSVKEDAAEALLPETDSDSSFFRMSILYLA